MKHLSKTAVYVAVLLFMFLLLTAFREPILAADQSLFVVINSLSNPLLDFIFVPLTYYGSTLFWLFMIFLFWIKNDKKISVHLIYAFAIDLFMSMSLKWFFQRDRPEGLLRHFVLSESDFGSSFPSGHAEKAFSGSAILSKFYQPKLAFYGIAALTALSRIYIGAHYPIDVLFGSVIGLMAGNIALSLPTKHVEEKINRLVHELKSGLKN